MDGVVVIGTRGETRAFEAAGLTCFEPDPGRMAERVQAEQVRCEVLAVTRSAFERLPGALGAPLQQGLWCELVIVPPAEDLRSATQIGDELRHIAAVRRSLRAA
ncbi:MAG: hypothetical protein R3D80_06935 [Paracoccaceae bacterium]|nr:hypothetical protein [Maritimibacter sp.]